MIVANSTEPIGQPPVNTGLPAVSGDALVGQTLTSTTGTWTGDQPITFGFEWQRCDGESEHCTYIAGSAASTYTVTGDDRGKTLRVRVRATNGVGYQEAFSLSTAPVPGVPESSAPSNTVRPTVGGDALVGSTLTASPGTWTGDQPIAFGFQWVRCDGEDGEHCSSIDGAIAQAYTITGDDLGKRLRVIVHATSTAGHGDAYSASTAAVS